MHTKQTTDYGEDVLEGIFDRRLNLDNLGYRNIRLHGILRHYVEMWCDAVKPAGTDTLPFTIATIAGRYVNNIECKLKPAGHC